MGTQTQIARKPGVSRQLVTFALAGYPQVSEESRERILAAALEMGYRPNPHARALRLKKTGIIALWIPLGYVEAMKEAGLKPEFIYYPLSACGSGWLPRPVGQAVAAASLPKLNK